MGKVASDIQRRKTGSGLCYQYHCNQDLSLSLSLSLSSLKTCFSFFLFFIFLVPDLWECSYILHPGILEIFWGVY
ncbi:hypothetical protein VNO77_24064 [Canavalia gladiata]|uniref:Uncharacterized protein n=1 Tax=Canavalia gladiata TaxID=3824 RepID=A0AAN9QFV9_CANGL